MDSVDDYQEIGRFNKTVRRQIVIGVFCREQKLFLHVREYENHMYPTKNGIVMELNCLEQLIEQLEKARAYKGAY